jgi:hypothetical protein
MGWRKSVRLEKVSFEGEEKRNARGRWHRGLYIATVFDKTQ